MPIFGWFAGVLGSIGVVLSLITVGFWVLEFLSIIFFGF